MKITVCFVLIFVLGVFGALSISQEKLSGEDILKWFPDVSYEYIEHTNISVVKKAPTHDVYPALKLKTIWNSRVLPPILRDRCKSATLATIIEYYSEESFRAVEEDTIAGKDITGITQLLDSKGEANVEVLIVRFRAGIYEYNSTSFLLMAAFGTGEITTTGTKIGKQDIFTFQSAEYRGKPRTMFMVSAEGNKLLISEDIDFLKKMVSAGNSAEPSILSGSLSPIIQEALPYFGQMVDISFQGEFERKVIEEANRAGIQTSELFDFVVRSKTDSFALISTTEFREVIVEKSISIYPTTELAQAMVERQRQLRMERKGMDEFGNPEEGSKFLSFDGPRFIVSTLYSVDDIRQLRIRMKRYPKFFKKNHQD